MPVSGLPVLIKRKQGEAWEPFFQGPAVKYPEDGRRKNIRLLCRFLTIVDFSLLFLLLKVETSGSMEKSTYLALLRGINVGGRNIIRMTDLRDCFEDMGFRDVVTYIQSGNVVFSSAQESPELPERMIEAGLSRRFGYDAMTIVLSQAQMKGIVEEAPAGFGMEKEEYRYDVMFVKDHITPAGVIEQIMLNSEVDRVWAGMSVIYASRLIRLASRSRLTRIMSLPVYNQITIRNWNTTVKLYELMRTDR